MVACAVPAVTNLPSARVHATKAVAQPPAVGVISNRGSFQRVPIGSSVLGGPQGVVQSVGVKGGVQGGPPPLAGVQGGGAQGAHRAVEADAHAEPLPQGYQSKLQQYRVQMQILQTQETQQGPQGGPKEGPQHESQREPKGEPQGDSCIAPSAVVTLEGVPTAAMHDVPTAVAHLVAASAVADAQAQVHSDEAGSSLAEAPKGELTASAGEPARDLASSAEAWQACQATGGEGGADGDNGDNNDDVANGDGVAADLVGLSRGSTASTFVDVSVVEGVGDVIDVDVVDGDDAAHAEEQRPVNEGDLLEACALHAPSAATPQTLPPHPPGHSFATLGFPPHHHAPSAAGAALSVPSRQQRAARATRGRQPVTRHVGHRRPCLCCATAGGAALPRHPVRPGGLLCSKQYSLPNETYTKRSGRTCGAPSSVVTCRGWTSYTLSCRTRTTRVRDYSNALYYFVHRNPLKSRGGCLR